MKKINQDMLMAIRLCEAAGLNFCSSAVQMKRGTLKCMPPIHNGLKTYFTIHRNGYVRRYIKGGFSMRAWEGYQLNNTMKVETKYGMGTQRILLPGDYIALANKVIKTYKRAKKKASLK